MLKYQKIIIASVILLTAVFIADLFIRVSLLIYAGIIVALITFLGYGAANIRSGFYCSVLCSGNIKMRSVALTFDDGPDKDITPEVLDILNRNGIKAAFFCIGGKAESDPELIRRMDKEGHIVGNHSYSHHFFFDLFSSQRMTVEMKMTDDAIFKIISKKIKLFRPPYGVTNPPLARTIGKIKYHVIGWSLRSGDSVIIDEKRLLERITSGLKPGDIILFHDTKKITAIVLEKFIKFAKENGFIFERLDKHLGIEAYE